MGRIAICRWITPLKQLFLLAKISLLGDNGFEAFGIEMRCSADLSLVGFLEIRC